MPKKVKKRRMVRNEENHETNYEEYYDYIFPDDEATRSNLRILDNAKMWAKNKRQKT